MRFLSSIFLLLCSLLVSCRTTARHVELADQEIFSFVRKVKATNNLSLAAYGGGFYERVNSFSLIFTSPQYPNVEEARWLFFDVANRFLDQVNQSEALRPYMANYPFTIMDNLELLIVFPPSKESISSVGTGPIFPHLKRDRLVFSHYDPSTQDFDGGFTVKYEEALQLYENQKSSFNDSCYVD